MADTTLRTDADSEPVAWARRDYKERLERTGMTDICEHPDIEGSTEWMVPLYAAPVSESGEWPRNDLRRAFVEGMKWWQYTNGGATAFPAEVDQAEAEAERRYGAHGGCAESEQKDPADWRWNEQKQKFESWVPSPSEKDGEGPRTAKDGTDLLCEALYGRPAKPQDYLGGSNARMLNDAAHKIVQLERELAEANVTIQAISKKLGIERSHSEQLAAAQSASGTPWVDALSTPPERDGIYLTVLYGDVAEEAEPRAWHKGKWIYLDGSEPDVSVEYWMRIPMVPIDGRKE